MAYTWDDMMENLKQEYKDTVTEAEKLAKQLDGFISKDKAIDALCLDCAEETKCKDLCDNAKRILYLPAADVVPVVRCKNCKFWLRDRISVEGLARCQTGETGIRYRKATDFCSRGEVDNG